MRPSRIALDALALTGEAETVGGVGPLSRQVRRITGSSPERLLERARELQRRLIEDPSGRFDD
jgi:hypothetical protein